MDEYIFIFTQIMNLSTSQRQYYISRQQSYLNFLQFMLQFSNRLFKSQILLNIFISRWLYFGIQFYTNGWVIHVYLLKSSQYLQSKDQYEHYLFKFKSFAFMDIGSLVLECVLIHSCFYKSNTKLQFLLYLFSRYQGLIKIIF